MNLFWEARETHITPAVTIGQAEIEHDGEKVLFQIKPHGGMFGVSGDGLELVVQVYIPGATEARLRQVAQLMTDALYE